MSAEQARPRPTPAAPLSLRRRGRGEAGGTRTERGRRCGCSSARIPPNVPPYGSPPSPDYPLYPPAPATLPCPPTPPPGTSPLTRLLSCSRRIPLLGPSYWLLSTLSVYPPGMSRLSNFPTCCQDIREKE